jgi:hypothetical protein
LEHHAAEWAAGVDGFGGGGESDVGGFENVDEVDEVGDASAESVQPVDEKDVLEAGFGGVEGFLESGSFGGGAGGVVFVFGDDGPAVVGTDMFFEGGALGVERERLVFVVGGSPDVDADPAGSGRWGGIGRGGGASTAPFRWRACHQAVPPDRGP